MSIALPYITIEKLPYIEWYCDKYIYFCELSMSTDCDI